MHFHRLARITVWAGMAQSLAGLTYGQDPSPDSAAIHVYSPGGPSPTVGDGPRFAEFLQSADGRLIFKC
jgi:hypothetical protein